MHSSIIISIICFSCTLFIIFYALFTKLSQVGLDNRAYRDQLPLGFMLMWPIIRALVHFFGMHLPLSFRKKIHHKLCRGGADYILSAEQFFFSHFVAGIYLGICFYAVMSLLNLNLTSLLIGLSLFGMNLPYSWLNKKIKNRETTILKSLPLYLDILTLSMESGSNFTGALTTALKKSAPCPLQQEFSRMLREIQAGKSRAFALNNLNSRISLDGIQSFVSSIIQAEKTGSQVGQVLRAQADQRRFERFSKAEKLGMEAPVKLLGPLVIFIFPTTFIILLFLIFIKVHETGIISSNIIHTLMTNPIVTMTQVLEGIL